MALTLGSQPVPLAADADGVIRVARSRITLDTVVVAFNEGATPEEVAQQYSSLSLADVYDVVAYYLRHREAVDAYLQERSALGERVRSENEARFNPVGVRERLLERRPGEPGSHPLADLAGRWAEEGDDLVDTIRAGRRDSSRATPK